MGNIFNKNKKYVNYSNDRGLLMDNIQSNIDDTKKENDDFKRKLNYLEDKLVNFVSSTNKEISMIKLENDSLSNKNLELNRKLRNLNIITDEYFKRIQMIESKIVPSEVETESEFVSLNNNENLSDDNNSVSIDLGSDVNIEID